MINNLFSEIVNGVDVRQNLSQLRQEIRDNRIKEEVSELVEEHEEYIRNLLKAEDPKIRKNTVLLIGDLGKNEFLDDVFAAYLAEEQLFVKSAYLNALEGLSYESYLPQLKERIQILEAVEITEENRKHIASEMRELSELVVKVEGISKHKFTGYHKEAELMVLTNRLHIQATMDQIQDGETFATSAGFRLKTKNIEEVLELRTYQEILFLVPGMHNAPMDPVLAAQKITDSELLTFLEKRHNGRAPFHFRIEIKSKMPLNKKSFFAKKIASEIERNTKRKLVNSTTNYEMELRFIENKEGSFNLLLKLFTIPDERFSYRKEHIANSIKPVNAALLVELAKPYMIEDARVLDPFCGVATMLIERQMVVKANTSYGIDILSDAIEKAKINTEAAGQIIHFVNRDFFDFTHDYRFDEIFTNMPFAIGRKTEEEIYDIYEGFFRRAKSFLEKEGKIIMYTHNRDYVIRLAKENGYVILKEFNILAKEETQLFIIK